MHHSPFTVAGMSTSSGAHHSPNLNPWGSTSTGGPLTTSFTDTLSQPRSHYQPGYLMSAQNNNAAPGNQRVDEVPVVPTKAKMNHVLSRGSAADFGMDSMFETTRQRQALADEDAPPTNSINSIPNEIYLDSSPGRFQPRSSTLDGGPTLSRRQTRQSSAAQPSEPLYIIVFGYPPDKYGVTVEYFDSLGEATGPDPNIEILNCFRIGYADAGDAMRAVRKNGEVLGGSWMIGVKWADPAQAEAVLGQPVLRSSVSGQLAESQPSQSNGTAIDEPNADPLTTPHTATVGTPMKLAPSTSAFRRAGPVDKQSAIAHSQKDWGSGSSGATFAGGGVSTPNKGMLDQVSDLIFGW